MAKVTEAEKAMRKRGKWLCRAGWGLFGLSLLLPAIAVEVMGGSVWFSGWSCLGITYGVLWDVLMGLGGILTETDGILSTGLGVANTLLLASPILHRLNRKGPRRLRKLGIASAVATAWAACFVMDAAVGNIGNIGVGAYAWVLSFGLVTAGTLLVSKGQSNSVSNQRPTTVTRTPEEMAAVRELEDYLHGVVRPVELNPIDDDHDTVPMRNYCGAMA